MAAKPNFRSGLKTSVVDGGYCVGCGACAAAEPDFIQMKLTEHGFYQAVISENPDFNEDRVLAICPFSEEALNEDVVAAALFPRLPVHPKIGRYDKCYAGRVVAPDIYENSSSGGIGRWVLSRLLSQGHVDKVLLVFDRKADREGGELFSYGIADTSQEVLSASKSAYYPIEMSDVLQHVRRNPGRYAITGVPCFVKAVRASMRADPVLSDRIVFTLGVVCGHLKSRYYAEMIGWQVNVPPADLRAVDFRVKIPGRKANEKGVSALGAVQSKTTPATVQQLFGTNYGHGFFKYKACDYCDDVLAETADIAVGDAWLPQFLDGGTSIVVARSALATHLLKSGMADNVLKLEEVTADQVAKSQDAGLRHRREGLAYRLWLNRGRWQPLKRVLPSNRDIALGYRIIYRARIWIAQVSPVIFEKAKRFNSWKMFRLGMGLFIVINNFGYRVLSVSGKLRRFREVGKLK